VRRKVQAQRRGLNTPLSNNPTLPLQHSLKGCEKPSLKIFIVFIIFIVALKNRF
jgi:hypothetical protein